MDHEVLLEKSQKFLDRVIFICFCEDKGLLPNDLLHNAIKQAKTSFFISETPIWDQIRGVFKAIDKGMPNKDINTYDGGLFEYDKDLDNLIIKDEFFNIIYDFSDYDFDSDVDVNILGHIFEQSISDIEKLKSDIKENKFDKNQSRRKKEGIYYTPQYITSYIVENAVGGYLEDRKEDMGYYDLPDIEKAGSDSWQTRYTNQHLNFYNKYEDKLKNIKILDPACGSGAFLNQAFDYLLQEHQWLNKQRDLLKGGQSSIYGLETVQRNILRNNLYGVDLNEESVEITKLSLWLKTANKNKPLTNLDDNIKCGNSLIDDPEVAGDKAFNWEDEFKQIMDNGGFDIVIGNPPYVRFEYFPNIKVNYFKKKYVTAKKQFDLFCLMLEKGISLLNQNSYLGFIIPSLFLKGVQYNKLRKFILDKTNITIICEYGDGTFEGVEMPTTVIILNKCNNANKRKDNKFAYILQNSNFKKANTYSQIDLYNPDEYLFNFSTNIISKQILNKIEMNNIKLENILNITRGLELGKTHEGIKEKEFSGSKPLLSGEDIERYLIKNKKYISNNTLKQHFKSEEIFKNEKIIIRETGSRITSTFDSSGILTLRTLYNMWLKNTQSEKYYLLYILGIINSNLIQYYYAEKYKSNTEIFPKIRISQVKNIPISKINLNNQEQVVKKVKLLIELKKNKKEKINYNFSNLITRYTSNIGPTISTIKKQSEFFNQVYCGHARKVRDFIVNINTNIITLYSDKSGNGKYELLKFEEEDQYKRKYLKLYLENLTEEQLEKINSYSEKL